MVVVEYLAPPRCCKGQNKGMSGVAFLICKFGFGSAVRREISM